MFWDKKKPSHYEALSRKWVKKHVLIQENLWKKHKSALEHAQNKAKQLAVSTLAGTLLFLTPITHLALPQVRAAQDTPVVSDLNNQQSFLVDLSTAVPQDVRELSSQEEDVIAQILSEHTGLKVSAQLQGIRLNRTYGYIGKEQHLMRYPGDTITTHFANEADYAKFADSGMAPGLGGFGYFETNGVMTNDDVQREKYYIAVQTFLAPGWSEHVAKYVQFFKWRKMLVVNPQNGKAIVADIGDAGPAVWTGKSLGGSPEVMDYLERVDGAQKGPVLYFFIDDPENKVPLGPVAL